MGLPNNSVPNKQVLQFQWDTTTVNASRVEDAVLLQTLHSWTEMFSHGKPEKSSQLKRNNFQDCSQGTKGQRCYLAL